MHANSTTNRTSGANKSYRPVLVGLAEACLVLRLPRWAVLGMVEDGELCWVWDLSTQGRRRDLRFLLQELHGEQFATQQQAIDAVLGDPSQSVLRATDACSRLGIRFFALARLIDHNTLQANRIDHSRVEVDRASLAAWLRSRWLGADPPTPKRGAGAGLLLHPPVSPP